MPLPILIIEGLVSLGGGSRIFRLNITNVRACSRFMLGRGPGLGCAPIYWVFKNHLQAQVCLFLLIRHPNIGYWPIFQLLYCTEHVEWASHRSTAVGRESGAPAQGNLEE